MRSVWVGCGIVVGLSLGACGGSVRENQHDSPGSAGMGSPVSIPPMVGDRNDPVTGTGGTGSTVTSPIEPSNPIPARTPPEKGPPGAFVGPAFNDYVLIEIVGEDYGTLWDTAMVGDLNGDGLEDWFVVDRGGSALPESLKVGVRSAAYLFYGRASYPPSMSVLDADLIIRGADYVAGLGDIDGDDLPDVGVTHGCGCDSLGSEAMCGCVEASGIAILGGGQEHTGEARIDDVGVFTPIGERAPGSLSLQHATFIQGVGDLDADGYSDFVFGEEGKLMLFYGGPERAQHLDLNSYAAYWTSEYTGMGWGAGNVDGDDYHDLLVAGPETRLYHGGRRLNGNMDGGADATFQVETWGDLGHAVGDLDGDGFDDFALPTGKQVLFFYGGTLRFLGTLSADYRDFAMRLSFNDVLGFGAGDVNGDGWPDILLGDPLDQTNGFQSGALFVVPGSAGRVSHDLMIGPDQAALLGDPSGEYTSDLGYCISSGADVNGDGLDDILVAKPDNATGDQPGGKVMLLLGAQFQE